MSSDEDKDNGTAAPILPSTSVMKAQNSQWLASLKLDHSNMCCWEGVNKVNDYFNGKDSLLARSILFSKDDLYVLMNTYLGRNYSRSTLTKQLMVQEMREMAGKLVGLGKKEFEKQLREIEEVDGEESEAEKEPDDEVDGLDPSKLPLPSLLPNAPPLLVLAPPRSM